MGPPRFKEAARGGRRRFNEAARWGWVELEVGNGQTLVVLASMRRPFGGPWVRSMLVWSCPPHLRETGRARSLRVVRMWTSCPE